MFDPITGQVLGNVNLTELPAAVVGQISALITIFQAIGGLIIVYLVYTIVNLILNRKRYKEAAKTRELLEKINRKLDRIAKKR